MQGDKKTLRLRQGLPRDWLQAIDGGRSSFLPIKECFLVLRGGLCVGVLMAPHIHQNRGGNDIGQEHNIFPESELSGAFRFVDSSEMPGANTQNPVSPHNAHENSQA